MSMAAAITQLFTFEKDDHADRQLAYHEHESRRLANDPVALAGLITQAVPRINSLMIADLEEGKRRVREAAEAYCQRADDLILAFQERAEPMLDKMNSYASDVATATDLLASCPVLPKG